MKLGILVTEEFERCVVRGAESAGVRGAEPVEKRGGGGGGQKLQKRGEQSLLNVEGESLWE